MDEDDPYEPITFSQQIVDGERRTYAVLEWPERTRINAALMKIADPNIIGVNDDGAIVITCANGKAVYRKVCTHDDIIECELCHSSWSPIPPLDAVGDRENDPASKV